MEIAKIDWTAKKLAKLYKDKKVTFDNPMQRGFVWDAARRSRLIHSMLSGFPIPPMYTQKNEDDVYDVLDGKQRCNTIINFLNDMYMLKEESPVKLDDGNEFNVTRKKFSELPKDLQDRIRDYDLTVYYVQNATYDEKKEMFIRLNSGKAMSNVELTKAQTKSAREISTIASHPVFNQIMNEDAKDKSTNVGFAMQAYSIMFNENKCLLNSKIKETMKHKDISQAEVDELAKLFDAYVTVLDTLNENKGENAEVLKRIKRKSHFVSSLPAIKWAIDNSMSNEDLLAWFKMFFTSSYGATVSVKYNDTTEGGMNRDTSVKARIEAATDSIQRFAKGEVDQTEMVQSKDDQMTLS